MNAPGQYLNDFKMIWSLVAVRQVALKCCSASDRVHFFIYFIWQDPERTGGHSEGEDGPAGGQPLREEEILLLADGFAS